MKKGSVKPSPDSENRSRHLFPEEAPGDDRIIGGYNPTISVIKNLINLDQLMFVPSGQNQTSDDPEKVQLKTILVWSGIGGWGGVKGGR